MSQSPDLAMLTPSRLLIIEYSPNDLQQITLVLPPNLDSSSPFEIMLQRSATSTSLPPSPSYDKMTPDKLFKLADNEGSAEIIDLISDNNLVRWTWLHFQHCRHTAWRLEREAQQQKEIADTLFKHLRMDGIDEILRLMIRQPSSPSTMYFTASSSTPPLSPLRPANPAPSTNNSVSLATPSTPSSPFEEGMNIQWPIVIISDSSSKSPSPPSSSSSSTSSRKKAGSPLPRQRQGLWGVQSMVAGPSRS